MLVTALPWLEAPARAAAPLDEAWVEVRGPDDRARLGQLRHVAPAERTRGDELRVLVDEQGLDELARAGFRVVEAHARRASGPPPGYHTPEDGTASLEALAATSDRAGIASFGTSAAGRPIEAMWVGEPPGTAPSYRILAAHHGDEASSAEVALGLAARLVDPEDPVVDAILSRSTVWIVPYVNPDGVAAGTRENARGIDLNRNYDYQWSADALASGDRPFSEPETRAVRASAAFERPLASLTLHAGAVNVGWPWNYTTDEAPDADVLAWLGARYASACDQPGFWLTQGGDWYLTRGDTDDWAYGRYAGLDYTVEVSEVEEAAVLADVVRWHVDAILAFLSTGPGVEGTVVDAVSGAPVEATIEIPGRSRPFPSDAATGAFARILPPDLHVVTLQVSAPGYDTAELQVASPLPVEIALQPRSLTDQRIGPVALWRAEPLGVDATLEKPGEDPVPVSAGAAVDPTTLTPGAWSVVLADGSVVPHGLLVEDHGAAAVERWSDDGSVVAVDGAGFGVGARGWAFAGLERAPVEVPVDPVDGGRLEIPSAALPDADPVDLVLWTDGSVLAIADVRAGGTRSADPDEELIAVGGCGCDGLLTSRGAPAWSMVVAALAACSRRRA